MRTSKIFIKTNRRVFLMRTAVLSLLFMAVITPHVLAQSWSCRAPANCTESIICDSPQIQRLDEDMSSLYFRVRDTMPGFMARSLLDDQRQWLKSRDFCGCDANCIVRSYHIRIRELTKMLH